MSSPSLLYCFLKEKMKKMSAYTRLATILLASSMLSLSITFFERNKFLTTPICMHLKLEIEFSLSL
jgi:hypothetical protein